MPKALSALNDITAFVESKNTPGSGKRYIKRFIENIESIAQPNVEFALCNHPSLAKHQYSCRSYNDWVIAFQIVGKRFIVYEVILASMLY